MSNVPSRRSKKPELAITLVAGLMFAWLGGIEIYRWRLLHGQTAEALASVIAARRNPSHKAFGGPPYQVQYQFLALPSNRVFHYTGQILFTERWVRVPQQTWALVQSDKHVLVRYAPSDPRVNQPTSLALPDLVNPLGFLLFSLLSFVAGIATYRGGKSNNSFKPKPLRGSA